LGWLVSLPLLLMAAMLWWGTASSTSDARLAALQPVESAALAVHEQLIYNFANRGEFRQTIHRGYRDSWVWSGHRAPTLALVAWPYNLNPSAFWLCSLQILATLLGVVPAALIGRRHLKSSWGLGIGGLIYLSYPPVMALALQDYQDLVFALPCLTFALWAMGSRSVLVVALGAIVGLLPREETVALTVAAVLIVVPWRATKPYIHWRRYARNVVVVTVIAGAYGWWSTTSITVIGGTNVNPLAEVVDGLIANRGRQWPGLKSATPGFYELMFSPAAHPAILAPLHSLVGAGLLAIHAQIPSWQGVDRSWGEHVHHLAPAAVFLVVGTIVGAGRALRLIRRIPWVGSGMVVVAVVGVASWTVHFDRIWAAHYNLIVSWTTQEPAWTHPLWGLAALLPRDAVPAGPVVGAIVLSNRAKSFTYDGSLGSRRPQDGLAGCTHLLVDERHEVVLARGMDMPGAEVLGTDWPYRLIVWRPGALDPGRTVAITGSQGIPAGLWPKHRVHKVSRVPLVLGPYRRADLIPGVPPDG
jgi:hypothetical protein